MWQSGLMALAEWIAVSIALGGGVFAGSLLGVEIERVGPAVLKPVAMALLMMAGVHFCSMVDQVPGDSWSLSLSIPLVFLLAFFMFAGMFKADLAEGGIAAVIAMVLVCGIGLILAMNVDGELGRILGFGRPA